MATTVHIDFSKHSGTRDSGPTPSWIRWSASLVESASSSPYVSSPSHAQIAGTSGRDFACSMNRPYIFKTPVS
ncbi:hypothetical protein PTT_07677 [Pyrenophora teres f. teres 0-1]|uniref:Uncharacterized protein n=1 Tax=Pyrenophora teres f. teres (strain 0-1) TaxID=861557 RepID=E3RI62_PYRTT|nr:hypothetical protein PTT_07677 [Pyrenophora teres f. teres 0-1]